MKKGFVLLLLALLFVACSPTEQPSAISDATEDAVALLTEQVGLSEQSALDVLTQLWRAGYREEIRMAFPIGEGEASGCRVWLASTALDIALDEQGRVRSIRDGENVLTVPDPREDGQAVENPVEKQDNSVENVPQDVENPENIPEQAKNLTLLSLSSPIKAGEKATLRARGIAGEEYRISVRYASGESTAQGLEAQIAAPDGTLEWTFRVSARVAAGAYPVTVSGAGETLQLTLTVTE
jgi:hypothetical protein